MGSPAANLTPARVWWLAARPATLAASVAPVLAGTAVAVHDHRERLLPGLAALVVAIAMQLGVNYANDYSDHARGVDGPQRRGPLRAAASGLVAPGRVRAAALAAFGVASLAGLALSLATDWRLLGLGSLAVLAGWLYTGGPRPYGYSGLGEVFVFVFFGLVATAGTTYVQELRLPPLAGLAGVGLGCLACAILVLNNLRDRLPDAQAGKRTLAVKLGPAGSLRLLDALFLGALAVPLAAAGPAGGGWPALLPLAAIPAALAVRRRAASTEPPVLVDALRRAAGLELWYALLWAAGMLA